MVNPSTMPMIMNMMTISTSDLPAWLPAPGLALFVTAITSPVQWGHAESALVEPGAGLTAPTWDARLIPTAAPPVAELWAVRRRHARATTRPTIFRRQSQGGPNR